MDVQLNNYGWHKWKSGGRRAFVTRRVEEWHDATERTVGVQTPRNTRTNVNAEVVVGHRYSVRVRLPDGNVIKRKIVRDY